MLLERRLVRILWVEQIKKGVYWERSPFVLYVTEKKWPRLRYIGYNKQQFINLIDNVLGSCIEGSRNYIGWDEQRKYMVVAPAGQEFIKIPLGFYEEFLKRRRRSSSALFGFASGVGITGFAWAFKHFWPLISSWLKS